MSDSRGVTFNTTNSLDADLEREVDMLNEERRLKNLQEAAAEDEGVRKKAATSGEVTKGKSIFISGFDGARTTEADIRLFFDSCGTITRITLLKDKYSGQNKGTAYLEFDTVEQAQAALLKEGQTLHGRPLKVAVKRDNIPGFHRGGGAGYQGRGGRGGVPPAQMAMAMLSMMSGGFSPFPRGRGRGRGRGQ